MSRIGKLPILIPEGVQVEISKNLVSAKGKLGELTFDCEPGIKVRKDGNRILVTLLNPLEKGKMDVWGLSRSLVSNIIQGVSEGFVVKLEVRGTGYKVSIKNPILTLYLGFSHEIKYLVPSDIKIVCPKPTIIEISGCDKQRVGHVAATLRSLRKPDVYKGKGIRKVGEVVYTKEGKKK